MSAASRDLHELLDALGALRRFWERPDRKRRFLAELGEPVELGVVRAVVAVAGLPEDPEADRGVGAVGRVLDIDDSTASRVVEQAVRGGHLEREPSPVDRRRTSLALTERGRALAARTAEIRCRWLSELTASWTPEEVAALATLLRRFVEGAIDLEDPTREQ